MIKKHFRNIIGFDNERLTPAIHCYARVLATWLEVLTSYARRPNLTMIMSGLVLGMIKGSVVYFETQIGDWLSSLNPKNVQTLEDDERQGR